MAVLRPLHLVVICLALLPHNTTAEPVAIFLSAYGSDVLAMVRDTPSTGAASSYHHLHGAPPRCLDATARVTCSVAPSTEKSMLHALPLLAVPFLPLPVAALAALSTLASHADDACACTAPNANCDELAHASCCVYPYDGTIDRAHPLNVALCPHPLCHAGSDMRARSVAHALRQGLQDDPLHSYCTVRSVEMRAETYVMHDTDLPIADPDAVVASGGEVCYVELATMEYLEGYYIRCPVSEYNRMPFVCCTEFPHEAIAAAVWEHRRTTYRDAVGAQFDGGLEHHVEL